jgi:hypothetical protein
VALINLVIASGGIDARVNLLSITTLLKAQAKWFLNTDPGSLRGQAERFA